MTPQKPPASAFGDKVSSFGFSSSSRVSITRIVTLTIASLSLKLTTAVLKTETTLSLNKCSATGDVTNALGYGIVLSSRTLIKVRTVTILTKHSMLKA